MNIIGIHVFDVYLQIFTESKKVTHKSISYAAHAGARRSRRLRRLGRPIAEKLVEHFFIQIKLIRHVFRLQIFLFSILKVSMKHPYLCVLRGAARVGGAGVGSQSLRRYCLTFT